MYKPIPGYQLLHAMYMKPDKELNNDDAIIACVKHLETGDKRLHIIRNPGFEFWITKPAFRNQEQRLECESLNRVDAYACKYKDLYNAISRALGEYTVSRDRRKYNNNPHIYGLDVGPLVRMKIEYHQACNGKMPPIDIGMLDIETGVTDEFNEVILCASYTDWKTRRTYEFINSHWCPCYKEELEARMAKELQPFLDGLNEKASKVWNANKHEFIYVPCKNERDLIIHLIGTALMRKPDLCGVWNMSYDIPRIEKRAIFNQIYLPNLFCHPDVPEDLRYYHWKADTKEVEHFTDVWHQVEAPGYTRWYDPMCLYSRVRKVQGRENFYTLEYISSKIIGSGKMKFGVNSSHADMQTKDKIGYCIYNCFDTILPCVIDRVTDDTGSLMVLSDISELSEFSKQTVMLKNQWYNYCRYKINSVPGCAPGGASLDQPWDIFIHNIGGAVLSPNLLEVKGSPHLLESSAPTALHMLVNDIDATSMYPSILMSCNCGRITKYSTTLHVDGCPYALEEISAAYETMKNEENAKQKSLLNNTYKAMALANTEWMDEFFGKLATTEENAVDLCHQVFNLPNYSEMAELFKEYYRE